MHGTTLSFANLHQHGELFANILRARHKTAATAPARPDYDQYDTPQSRWIAVYDDNGEVLASVRLTPTTAQCGIYSYMVRDAQNGLLDNMPRDLLDEAAPQKVGTWEVTRGFVSPSVAPHMREEVRARLVAQLMQAAREEGITCMLALLPSTWGRWCNRYPLSMRPAGQMFDIDGQRHQAVWIDFATPLH